MLRPFGFVAMLCWVVRGNPCTAQVAPPTKLEIEVENIVGYNTDVFDASKFATDPNLTSV